MNERIKKLRDILCLSQDDFGDRIGITGSAVSHLEQGRRNITNQVITSICREFNVSEKWLRYGEGEIFVNNNLVMSERLKQIRKKSDMTQQEFADRLGVSRSNIATYETSKSFPSASIISLICKEFNVNENWLRYGNDEIFSNTDLSISERLKLIRNSFCLSQDEFGNKIGIKGASVSLLENGHRNATNQVILSVCREFGINEEWLRYGKGEMLVFSDSDDIKKLIIEYVNSTNDTYVLNLFATMSKFSQTEWDILKLLLKKLLDNM